MSISDQQRSLGHNMIGSIIKLLLNRNGILEIPGLGTFKSEYVPANIQFASRTIAPFTAQIEFSVRLIGGQAAELQKYLVSELKTTAQQAELYVDNFVTEANRALQSNRRFEVKGLGWLLLNIEGGIHFQIYQDFSYNLEAYGLKVLMAENVYAKAKVNPERETPVIPLHPFDEEIPQAFEREAEKKPVLKWASVAAVFIATIVSIGSVYMLSQQNFSADNGSVSSKPVTQEATLVPVGKSDEVVASKEKNENKKPVIEVSNGTTPTTAIPDKQESIQVQSKVFFVVAGSFQDETRSKSLNKSLGQKGYASEILTKNENGFIRVSLGKFTTKDEAISFLNTTQKDFKENLWVLTENN